MVGPTQASQGCSSFNLKNSSQFQTGKYVWDSFWTSKQKSNIVMTSYMIALTTFSSFSFWYFWVLGQLWPAGGFMDFQILNPSKCHKFSKIWSMSTRQQSPYLSYNHDHKNDIWIHFVQEKWLNDHWA